MPTARRPPGENLAIDPVTIEALAQKEVIKGILGIGIFASGVRLDCAATMFA
jgi:hypothetical protein